MKPSSLKNTIFEDFSSLNQIFSTHNHSSYSIGVTHDGLFVSSYSGSTHCVYGGHTRVLNPMEAHGGHSKSWSLTNFYPPVSLMQSIYEQIFYIPKVPMFQKHIIDDTHLYGLLLSFFRAIYASDDSMETESLMIEALSYLLLNYADIQNSWELTDPSRASLLRTTDMIWDMVGETLTLDDLSKESGVSKYHFLRCFKKHTGLTPHQYILSARVQKATDKIISGGSIADASVACGFSDQSHFTRHFKRIYGYTPSKIRQKSNIILYT